MINADLILMSDAVFTATGMKPFPGGVAIKENKIIAVAGRDELKAYIGPDTAIREYGNKLIMPGFIDGHVHYFVGAISASEHMCTEIGRSKSEEECVEIIKAFAEAHPEEKRILGIGWFPANWNDAALPTKKSLDEAIPDRPVYLIAADVHTFWMNTKALDESGIHADLRPKSGEIGLLENGELSGLLFEPEAFGPAMAKVMDLEPEAMKKMHKDFLNKIAQSGVTGISDMSADDYTDATEKSYDAVKSLENEGDLTSRLHLFTKMESYEDFSKAKEWQKRYNSSFMKVSGVKAFVDGVTSTHTAYLLEPYDDKQETCGIGAPIAPRESLEKSIVSANRAGLPVRLHCIGDAAVRMALDMYETSIAKNGNHGCTNTIEHIESIHPDDIKRFAELDVVPSMQPYHLTLDYNEKIQRIGMERCRWEWPHRSLLDAGAKLAFGTDYPVVDFDPFPSIYAAVTRKDDDGNNTGVNPGEIISLEEALTAYTAGAANAYGRLAELGTLETDKFADVVVIDRNLFAVMEKDILNARVELTVMDGRVVYERTTCD